MSVQSEKIGNDNNRFIDRFGRDARRSQFLFLSNTESLAHVSRNQGEVNGEKMRPLENNAWVWLCFLRKIKPQFVVSVKTMAMLT